MNEPITRLLLTYPRRKWSQKELVEITGYTKGFISQEVKKLVHENILVKAGNKLTLVDFSKLLNKWSGTRKLPNAIYFEDNTTSILHLLKKSKIDYALTLFSGAWQRINFMKTQKIEFYTTSKYLKLLSKKFRRTLVSNIEVYVTDGSEFIGCEKIKGLFVVSVVQNYVDLMAVGGNGIRVAQQLAKILGV